MKDRIYESGKAARWSAVTEVFARLVIPVTNMILARLLTPESFGVIATVTMITSFADIFTDAGFQKYLIQHEFENSKELENNANVALWANFIISVFLWILISVFSEQLATAVGCPGLGRVIIVACCLLPMTAFSCIQRALFKRSFNYRTLFFVRMVYVSIPFFVTIPLALLGLQYWALIIGTICGEAVNAILLVRRSKWKPVLYFDFGVFREMFSYSFWTLIESISIWLTSWIGTFIVGTKLSSYYVGLYKTSMSTVNSLMAIVTTAFTSVLFSLLSRYQNDNDAFLKTFYKYQKFVGSLVLPMGIGLFLYRGLVTSLFLGKQWMEAADFIGLWGLVYAISITFGHFCSEVYRAKGKPKLSVVAQWLHIIVLAPACYWGAERGFHTLCEWRSYVRFEFIAVHFVIMWKYFKIPAWKLIMNVKTAIISTIAMGSVLVILQQLSENMIYQFGCIAVGVSVYFFVYSLQEDIKTVIEDVMIDRKIEREG